MKSLLDIEVKKLATGLGREAVSRLRRAGTASTEQPIELERTREAMGLECSRLHTRTQCQRNGVGVPEVVSAFERRGEL